VVVVLFLLEVLAGEEHFAQLFGDLLELRLPGCGGGLLVLDAGLALVAVGQAEC